MISRFKATTLFLLALIATLGLAPSALAQAISGDLVGTVQDASGAALPSITVTATNTGTNVKSTGVTNQAATTESPTCRLATMTFRPEPRASRPPP